jgi:hypothetical protein
LVALNVRRITGLALALGALAAVVVFAQPVTRIVQREWIAWQNRPDPIVATDEEMAAIIREVVTANRWSSQSRKEQGKPLKLMLVDRTMDFCPAPAPEQKSQYCSTDSMGAMIRGFPWGQPMTEKLRREMELASRTVRKVPDPHLPTVDLLDTAAMDAVFRNGDEWDEFYARFPDAGSTFQVSVPVLTPDRSQALIYVEQMCDGLCAIGEAFLLERTAQGWKQIAKVKLWIS